MAFENNTPHLRNTTVDATREISERRAATISRMVDEAAKRGLDDQFAYDAVADYGRDNAKEFRKTLKTQIPSKSSSTISAPITTTKSMRWKRSRRPPMSSR